MREIIMFIITIFFIWAHFFVAVQHFNKRFDELMVSKQQPTLTVKCGPKCPLCGHKIWVEQEDTLVKE